MEDASIITNTYGSRFLTMAHIDSYLGLCVVQLCGRSCAPTPIQTMASCGSGLRHCGSPWPSGKAVDLNAPKGSKVPKHGACWVSILHKNRKYSVG